MLLHNRCYGPCKRPVRLWDKAGCKEKIVRLAQAMRPAAVPIIALTIITMTIASQAMARDSLGMFERWGAFRDAAVPRCYAIAQPVVGGGAARGFATVGNWPRQRVRGQLHVRLSRPRAKEAPVTLSVGDRKFALVAGH